MKTYGILALIIATVLLVMFFVFEDNAVLAHPEQEIVKANPAAVLLSIGLLVVDVFLPIPSSLVMTANGAAFGIVTGTIISVAGSTLAAILGYLIGQRGSQLIRRMVTPAEQERTQKLLQRWGTLAVICSRPVPILAETMMIIAGVSGMDWRPALLSAFVGSIPAALLYAIAGASAVKTGEFILVFGSVLALGGVFWFIGMRFRKEQKTAEPST